MNSSCLGPILPTYSLKNWDEIFKYQLNDAHLIAPILEFPPLNDNM